MLVFIEVSIRDGFCRRYNPSGSLWLMARRYLSFARNKPLRYQNRHEQLAVFLSSAPFKYHAFARLMATGNSSPQSGQSEFLDSCSYKSKSRKNAKAQRQHRFAVLI